MLEKRPWRDVPAFLAPLVGGARRRFRVLAEEQGAANILYSVPVPAEEVVTFYREVTTKEGYALQAGAEAAHFALGRPGSSRWEVEVHERAQGTSKSTLVMLHELGAPR